MSILIGKMKTFMNPFLTVGTRSLITTSNNKAWLGFSKDQEKTSSHSMLLSKDQSVYEIVTDTVIPSQWDSYLQHKKKLVECAASNQQLKGKLMASWTIVTGDTAFKAVHLYKYEQGWTDIDTTRAAIKQDSDYQALYTAGLPVIRQQFTELTKAFSFWPSPDQREGGNVYDIRSYSLRPGSMYDWSMNWSRGIQYRSAVRLDVPYAGLFTQLGQLHTIYHIWCYKSMADRKACREATWHYPEWNDVVANTVPLVKTMKTRILEPLDFSPTQ
eukprot:GFUD01019064.1.p1 GENE.GFUD01019064.1~~GFUD01019064.1.p1  ORF type:complete len:272 (+),score=74.53 GFUD01019064.1:155-970(+)